MTSYEMRISDWSSDVCSSDLGFSLMTLDLSDTTSLAEAQAAIKKYAADNPETPWIIGRGWNQEKWGLGRFATAAEIDSVVADRPEWRERVDGLAAWSKRAVTIQTPVNAETTATEERGRRQGREHVCQNL